MENDEDLYGIVTLQDMERALERKGVVMRDLKVDDVSTTDPVTVFPDEPIWSAIRKMGPRDLARLPVVSRHAEQKLLGLISRSDILRAYDVGLLKKQQAQHIRERMALRKVSGVEFIEVKVNSGCACAGKKLAEIKLPQSATVVSIERGGTVLIPDGGTEILPKDQLTIFCQTNLIRDVRTMFADRSDLTG
ncbi:MAG: CBS domain-containing protein [Deltaproteobacteria bacterium]|nr:CBS domain-containing protein [Deltaproteobacteria bacterium]